MAAVRPGRRHRRPDAVPLGDYARVVRRAIPVVTGCALLGGVLHLAWTMESATVYSATSTVLAAEAPLYLSRSGATPAKVYTMDTEAARLVSTPVLRAARLATQEPDVTSRVKISAVPATKVLKVTYRSTDRAAAGRGAAAMTGKYLEIRRLELEARRQGRVEEIGRQLTVLTKRLDAAVGARTSTEAVTQQAVRAALTRQIAERQAESRRLRQLSVYPGQLLRSGGTVVVRRPHPVVPVARGLALGTLVGALLAAAAAARLGSRADVERLVRGTPVVRLPRRWQHTGPRRRLAGWDPIATALLKVRPEAVAVSPLGRQPRMADAAIARELTEVLAAHGRTTWLRDAGTLRPAELVVPPGSTMVVAGEALDREGGSVLAADAHHVVLVTTPATHRRKLIAAFHQAGEVGATISGVVLVPRTSRPPRGVDAPSLEGSPG